MGMGMGLLSGGLQSAEAALPSAFVPTESIP